MDRRQVLKIGLASGLVVMAYEVDGGSPAEAAKKPSVVFYEGTVTGTGFEGWKCLFAKTGKSVRGSLFDPATVVNGHFTGFRARGSVGRGSTLEMNFFAMDDIEFATPLGSVNGKATNKSLTANFDVNGQSGAIDSTAAKLSAKRTKKFVAVMDCDVFDPEIGEKVATFQTVSKANGTFTVSNIETEVALPVVIPTQITGRFGVTAKDEVFVVTLINPQVAAKFRGQAGVANGLPTPSEVNKADVLGGPESLQSLDCSLACGILACLCGMLQRPR